MSSFCDHYVLTFTLALLSSFPDFLDKINGVLFLDSVFDPTVFL